MILRQLIVAKFCSMVLVGVTQFEVSVPQSPLHSRLEIIEEKERILVLLVRMNLSQTHVTITEFQNIL